MFWAAFLSTMIGGVSPIDSAKPPAQTRTRATPDSNRSPWLGMFLTLLQYPRCCTSLSPSSPMTSCDN